MVDERELGHALKEITEEWRFRQYEGTPVEWAYLEDRRYAVRLVDKKDKLTFILATCPRDAVMQYVALFKIINIQYLESLA